MIDNGEMMTDRTERIEEKILTIVTSIVRIIVTTQNRDDLDSSIFSELVSSGFKPAEITEAFGVLAHVISSLKIETTVMTSDREGGDPRILTNFETLRMSDDAVKLFREWQSQSLMSQYESEEILRQVMLTEAGDVDVDDLFRFAENAGLKGSVLSLYVAAHNLQPQ